MKRLLYTVLAVMVAATSCQKDTLITPNTPENPGEIISQVLMEGNFHFTPIDNNQWVSCLTEEDGIKMAKNYTITGTLTEMVHIQETESMMRIISCQSTFFDRGEEGIEKMIRTKGEGVLTDEFGNQMKFILWTDYSDMDGFLSGQFQIKGGTGKFECCTGWMTLKGNYNKPDGSSDLSGDGYMNFHISLK